MTARDRLVIIVVVALAALAAAWLLEVAPKRNQASSLGNQITAEQQQLASIQGQLTQAMSARRAFAADYAQLARLGEAVPPDDDIPSLIYEIQSAATASHVDFHGLELAAGSGGASSSSTAAPLPPGAAVGPAGLPTEQFTFAFQGSFFNLSNFFNRLARFVVSTKTGVSVSGRLLTINSIGLAAGPAGFPQITATVAATTYIVPAAQGLLDGATPTGPAASAPSTPALGSTSSLAARAASAAITSPIK